MPPPYDQDFDCPGFMKNDSDTAVLMLTSGSTGTSKAVVGCFSEFLYPFFNVLGLLGHLDLS